MILGREFGSKTGGGGASSKQDEEIARRERLKKIALETIDLKSVRTTALMAFFLTSLGPIHDS